MDKRFLTFLALACFALADAGCASKDVEYELMPLQTGSVLQRRVVVSKPSTEKKKTKKKKDKKPASTKATPTPEPERSPKPEEESTPQPERFR
jgi:hypothetical protein